MAEPVPSPVASPPSPAVPAPVFDAVKFGEELLAKVPAILAAALIKRDADAKITSDAAAAAAAAEKARASEGALEAVKRLETELKVRDAALESERSANAVRTAVSKISFVDAEDAVKELAPKATKKDGQYVVPTTRLVQGVQIADLVTLDQAAADLAKAKPHWVKANPQSGSGASGGTDAPISLDKLTYKDLLADPAKMRQAKQKKPELVTQLRAENDAQRLAKRS